MIDPMNLQPPIKGKAKQQWILFGIAVAGRKASVIAAKVDQLVRPGHWAGMSPFSTIRAFVREGMLSKQLHSVRMGQYTRIQRAYEGLMELGRTKLTVRALESIHGIGPKTARMLMMYIEPDLRAAALDVHVLRFLRLNGFKAPKDTPPAGKRYRKLENGFLWLADKRGMTPRELDTLVWQTAARGGDLSKL